MKSNNLHFSTLHMVCVIRTLDYSSIAKQVGVMTGIPVLILRAAMSAAAICDEVAAKQVMTQCHGLLST